jgi:hypothetical protein
VKRRKSISSSQSFFLQSAVDAIGLYHWRKFNCVGVALRVMTGTRVLQTAVAAVIGEWEHTRALNARDVYAYVSMRTGHQRGGVQMVSGRPKGREESDVKGPWAVQARHILKEATCDE